MKGTKRPLTITTTTTTTQWELRGYKRKPGRPKKNWMDIIRRDLKDMDITWD